MAADSPAHTDSPARAGGYTADAFLGAGTFGQVFGSRVPPFVITGGYLEPPPPAAAGAATAGAAAAAAAPPSTALVPGGRPAPPARCLRDLVAKKARVSSDAYAFHDDEIDLVWLAGASGAGIDSALRPPGAPVATVAGWPVESRELDTLLALGATGAGAAAAAGQPLPELDAAAARHDLPAAPIVPVVVSAFYTLERSGEDVALLVAAPPDLAEHRDECDRRGVVRKCVRQVWLTADGARVCLHEPAELAAQDTSRKLDLYIVTERFGRDLLHWLRTVPVLLSQCPDILRCIVRQCVHLVADLHAQGLTHRDLKPANILLEWGEGAYPLLRLCDLGSARKLGPGTPPATPFVTSRFFRAPELLCGSDSYGPPVDTWALACTIAELYLTVASFTDPDAAEVISHRRGDGGSFDARQRALRVQHVAAPRMRAREAAHARAAATAAAAAHSLGGGGQSGGCWLGTARKTLQFDAAADDDGFDSDGGDRVASSHGGQRAEGAAAAAGEEGDEEVAAFDGPREVRAARDRYAQCVARAQALAADTASPRAGSNPRVYARLHRVRASLHSDVEVAQADWDHARDMAQPGAAARYRWAQAAPSSTLSSARGGGGSCGEESDAGGGGASASSSNSGHAEVPALAPPPPQQDDPAPAARLPVSNTNLFNGATCDGEQLAQIINLLGTPTPAEVAGMRLGPAHGALLRGMVATVAASVAADAGARVPRQGSAPYDTASSSASASSTSMSAAAAATAAVPSGGAGSGGGGSAPAQQRALPSKDVAAFLARRGVPRDVAGMLAGMLAWDPAARTTPAAALRHPALLLALPAITPASRIKAAAAVATAAAVAGAAAAV